MPAALDMPLREMKNILQSAAVIRIPENTGSYPIDPIRHLVGCTDGGHPRHLPPHTGIIHKQGADLVAEEEQEDGGKGHEKDPQKNCQVACSSVPLSSVWVGSPGVTQHVFIWLRTVLPRSYIAVSELHSAKCLYSFVRPTWQSRCSGSHHCAKNLHKGRSSAG